VKAFHRDGYVIVKNFFSAEEINKLYGIAIGDEFYETSFKVEANKLIL
jgi:hypothetical protein